MVRCPDCNSAISATYKKDADRYYWEIYIEKTRPKKPFGGGCGTAILIIIILSLAIAAVQCDWTIPPPDRLDETVEGEK
ncbi:MAG: hypothetical protein JMDDDDMK_00136 [Acidobacteria bacterium]|nr:hypothetical protein [Acidobacteriota bacterium]